MNTPGSCATAKLPRSGHQPPLAPTTVLELARRIQRWQQDADGLDHAPKPIRRTVLQARDWLVSHTFAWCPTSGGAVAAASLPAMRPPPTLPGGGAPPDAVGQNSAAAKRYSFATQ